MQFTQMLNQPDAGEISVNLNDPKAVDITNGRLIKMVYRGAPIGSGGFFVENIVDDRAAGGDRAGQWKKVSGRGGLAILDDGIIYPVTDETSRTFTAVTMGSILLTLITEAKARGCFPSMRTEFSATQDSNGDLWTDVTTITLNVGTSLLDVARQFSELGLEFTLIFDWILGDYALCAYGTAIGTDKSADVVVRIGQNAEQVSESNESSALKNAYLVAYQAGMTNTSDATSIAAYRRREAFFQASNAPSSGSALVLANAELAARKDPVHSIQVKLNDGANPPKYGVDYDLGDWIGVDTGNGLANSVYRIRGINLDWQTDKKYASITLTLNSIKLEQELKTAIAMRKIANGSLGGGTSGVSPDAAAAINVHDGDATAHVNRPLSGDLDGTLGAPVVAKLRGVDIKNPLTVSTRQVLQYNPTSHELEMGDTPAHATTHQSGGADAIKLDDLATPDNNTDLNVSTTAHGLCPVLPNDDTKFLNGKGGYTTPAGGSGGSIAVEEVDGSPAIAACTKIKFPNGSLTDEGSGVVRVGAVAFSGAVLTKSATQSITTSTNTPISFDGEVYDTDNYHDNSTNNTRLTAPVTGYYLVGGTVEYLSVSSTTNVATYIMKGGAAADGDGRARATSANPVAIPFSRIVKMNAGDYVELIAWHNLGSNATVRESTNGTSFWITRIG